MVFSKVVSTILEGCGSDLRGVSSSKHFQATRAHFLALPRKLRGAPRHSALLRAGHLETGAWLSGFASDPAFSTTRMSVDNRGWTETADEWAWIRFIGDLAIQACLPCLPDQYIPWPKEDNESTSSRGLLGDARRWKRQSVDERLRTLQLLMQTFSPPHRDRKTNAEDRADQGLERVLPLRYGKWMRGEGNRANCLAKAMLVAAFARLAKAKVLIATPFTCIHRFRERGRGKAAEAVLRSLEKMGFPLSEKRRIGLQSIAQFGMDEDQERAFPHYSVAFEVGENVWAMLDPNFGFVSTLPQTWDLGRTWRNLRELRDTLPGLSVFRFGEEPDFRAEVSHISTIDAELESFLKRGLAATTKEEVIQHLCGSRFLDEFLKNPVFSDESLGPHRNRRREAICALLETLIWLFESRRTARQQTGHESEAPTEEFPCMWPLRQESSEEELLQEINDGQAKEAFLTLVFSLAVEGVHRIEDRYECLREQGELLSPAYQFALAGPGSAVPLLSHAALTFGEAAGDKVEAILSRSSFDVHRLTFAAGRKFRRLPSNGPVEDRSVELLRRFPHLPFSAERLIREETLATVSANNRSEA